VVTPTFAAGLGVVVAAFLAYPMRTVFSYAAPGGAQCQVRSCSYASQPGGQPASGPGQQLGTGGQTTSPGAPGAGPGSAPSSSPTSPSTGGAVPTVAAGPSLSYWTSRRGDSSFGGRITITFGPGATPAHWRLRFGYPSARILRVWASKYLYLHHGTHTAVVASGTWPKQAPAGQPIAVTIGVTGHPGPPRKCTFNGQACHITQHTAAKTTAGSH
jgi:hypothetical protein